jgi:GTPase KRas protein
VLIKRAQQIVLDRFIESSNLTLEDNYRKLLVIDGEQALLEFLNIGDIEAYPAVRTQSLKACTCAMIVYSVCSRSSFEQASAIHQEIIDVRGDRSFPICLVGNKKDEMEWREVSFEEGSELAGRLGCAFEECSAKDGTNADKIVFDLVKTVRRRQA